MRQIVFIVLLFSLFVVQNIFAQDYKTTFSQDKNGDYIIDIELKNWNVEHININNADFQKIVFSSSVKTEKKGWAELPLINTSIQIPNAQNFELANVEPVFEEINLDYPLLPSRGVIYRNQNPNEIPYEIAPESLVDEYYPTNITSVETPFIIRNVRGTSIKFIPFQYNPITKKLRIYKKIRLQGECNNKTEIINPLLNLNKNLTKDEIAMYKSVFINYNAPKVALATGQYGDILVIYTSRDAQTIQPYIQWKREKGYNVFEEQVTTGTNVKTLIQQKYTANPNLFYVQLVGDWADIKSDLGGGANAPTDPVMGCVVGTDNFPDIAIGRFSCSNATELQTQINKAINYEKNPNMDTDWREAFIGIASNEGSGSGDDGEIDYTHVQRIYTERLANFTYTTHKQNYDPGASASILAGHINSGASTIAYCGHGSENSFVTTGFSNSNINNLANGDKLPFIISVACVNGAFHGSSDCFAEGWLKKQNGGAVVTAMSTINQPWTPPQRIQDYFYDILVGGFDYSQYSGQNGINTNEQRTFWGSIIVNAFNLGYSESSTSSDLETIQTWTTFGDVALQLRTKQPDIITSSNITILPNVPFETTITKNGNPVVDAMVCISQNGVYYSALTNANGEVSIYNDFTPGESLLVVSAFNTTTISETINVISLQIPFLVKENYTLGDDGILSYGETSDLTLSLKNIGLENLTGNTTVTISCTDPLLTINTASATYPPIAIEQIVDVPNAYNITCSQNITNGYNFTIHWIAVNDTNIWEGNFQISAYKPELQFGQVLWFGSFQPGTTIPISISYRNTGGFEATNCIAILSCNNPNINILNPTFNYGTIQAGGETFEIYQVEISANATENDIFDFISNIVADNNITASGTFSLSNVFVCTVVVDMQDSYGDGWNSGKLTFQFDDGTANQVVQLASGASGSQTLNINKNTNVTVKWTQGQYNGYWDAECSFQIYYDNGTQIYASSGAPQQGTIHVFTSDCSNEIIECGTISNLQFEYQNPNVVLSWDESASTTTFVIYKNGTQIGTSTQPTFIDQNANGDATYMIVAVNPNEDCVIFPLTETFVVPTICNLSITLIGQVNGQNVELSWNSLECADSYNLYLNNELLANGLTIANYIHENENIEIGNYCYSVTAVNIIGESNPSNEVCFQYIGINENMSSNLSIYPNPTTGCLTVDCENMQQIYLYSIENKLIKTYIVKSDTFNFDINELAKGFYLLKIKNNTGVITNKIIKE